MTIDLILAPNPGPMSLEGTNTYLLGEVDAARIVVDPGPSDSQHLAAVVAAAPAGIAEIHLTHHHLDHLQAVPELARRTGATVRAWRTPDELGIEVDDFVGFTDDQLLQLGSVTVRILHLPGHTADSVGFLVSQTDPDPSASGPVLLTGDTVLGRGTTVITHPDGDLGAYLRSLDRIRKLTEAAGVIALLPGHGPRIDDPIGFLDDLVQHRWQRLDQVRQALAAGAASAEDVVEIVYADVDPTVKQAAAMSVLAQLHYLQRTEGIGPG